MSVSADVPPPLAIIRVQPAGQVWHLTSSDGLFFGIFRDRGSALKHAHSEADGHPGHIVLVRDRAPSCAVPQTGVVVSGAL